MHFPEPSPVCTWGRFQSAETVWVEERLVASDKAVECRDAFGLKGMLNEHIVIHCENLNGILA